MAIIADSTGAKLLGVTKLGQVIETPVIGWHLTTDEVKPILPRIQLTDLFDYAVRTKDSLVTWDGCWLKPDEQEGWLQSVLAAYEHYLNDTEAF